MKKFTLLFLSFLMIVAVNAQFIHNQKTIRLDQSGKSIPSAAPKSTNATVPYLETFDAGIPADYVITDLDGNTVYTPYQSFITDAWVAATLTGFATPAATSCSWYNTPGTSNDWMITAGIDIPASGTFEIKWKAKASDTSPYNDSYEVYVTSTIAGATPVTTDFSTPVYSNAGENNAWTNRNYVLPGTFNGQTIYIAFRNNMNDGNLLSIDDLEVKSYSAITNDVEVNKTFADFQGFSYYEVIPLSQAIDVDLAAVVTNNGSANQTNVVLTADDATNALNATTTPVGLASGASDTLVANTAIDNLVAADYTFTMNVTQTETDEVPANNAGEDVVFYTDNAAYFRSTNLNTLLTSYSFGTQAPAATGFEYGANYHFMNDDQIDSIMVIIYGANGTGTVTGKVYNIDLGTGAYTQVASTSPYTPAGTPEFKTLALTTPYAFTGGVFLAATVQLNINVSANDTIKIGADGTFPGVSGIACSAYLNVGGTFDWYTVTNTVPVVGLIMHQTGAGINQTINTKDVMVYPNPVSNTLYIMNQKAVNVEVYNLTGEIVAKYSNQNVINVSGFAQGTYLVKVTTDSKVITEKINIVH